MSFEPCSNQVATVLRRIWPVGAVRRHQELIGLVGMGIAQTKVASDSGMEQVHRGVKGVILGAGAVEVGQDPLCLRTKDFSGGFRSRGRQRSERSLLASLQNRGT